MCSEYIGAGLSPERFWEITPRLYLVEMQGAGKRMRRERALVWDNAVMSREGAKPPKREEYVGKERREPKTWQEQLSAWQAYIQVKNNGA